MAWAVCGTCGVEQQWSARRGARLADLVCGRCGGTLRAKPVPGRRTNAGESYGRCARCGARKLYRSLIQVRRSWETWDTQPLVAGTWVCRTHELRCPGLGDGFAHQWLLVQDAEAGLRCVRCEDRGEPSEAEREGMEAIEPYSDAEYTGL